MGSILAAGGCTMIGNSPNTVPDRYTVHRDQLVIHSDFPLARRHRLLQELSAQRDDVVEQLRLPVSDEPIHVYLFETAQRFHQFVQMHYPDFPPRRAFFVESDTRLAVFAHWGDRVAEDLRHETAHGYIHSVVPNLPLWLDEGLAEYFEVPRGRGGVSRLHLDELLRRQANGSWQPDLVRLEGLRSIDEMSQIDYAESWAWVHFLLHTAPPNRELLTGHLAALRENGAAEPLSITLSRSIEIPVGQMLEHLRTVEDSSSSIAAR